MTTTKTILQLNSCCLHEVLKQIKRNCEIDDAPRASKYADLINFALACDWFGDILHEWNTELYNQLENTYYNEFSDVIVDFARIYKHKPSAKDLEAFWNMCVPALQTNNNLKELELIDERESCDETLAEYFHKIMCAVENKETVKTFKVSMRAYRIVSVPQFRQLRELHLNVRLDALQLLKFCELNQNLTALHIMNNEIVGNFDKLVDVCSNVKTFAFQTKRNIDDAEYTPLAKLPKLDSLCIQPAHQTGSLESFFNALVKKQSNSLQRIQIRGAAISAKEFDNLLSIPTLKELECDLPLNYESVSQLRKI
ncbi:uncharacterized protein LOC108598161 [Drosophila busckii]|uniref:uncharacterized protein LOC108598161 n=1 Tax=Drosophila busckii TaxID=30019 RepID=UPI00083EDBD7|nr:uncharacterized protein LOC108598161 [Drosophila busckii]